MLDEKTKHFRQERKEIYSLDSVVYKGYIADREYTFFLKGEKAYDY